MKTMTDPYKLPDGNVQISFSGGRTSAFMLHQILEANGDLPDRCQVMFATPAEKCRRRWPLYMNVLCAGMCLLCGLSMTGLMAKLVTKWSTIILAA